MTSSRHTGERWLTTVALLLVSSAIACSSDDASTPTNPADGGSSDDASATGDAGDGATDANADPSRHGDPQDVDAMNGDPSIDIAGSWIYFDNGQPWVRVEVFGPWPPPATLYAWSCSVLLGNGNAPLASYTVRSLDGTPTEYADGIDAAKIAFAAEPKGFRVMFGDATLAFDHYGIECDVKKAASGPVVQDSSGSFEVKTKEPRTFGP